MTVSNNCRDTDWIISKTLSRISNSFALLFSCVVKNQDMNSLRKLLLENIAWWLCSCLCKCFVVCFPPSCQIGYSGQLGVGYTRCCINTLSLYILWLDIWRWWSHNIRFLMVTRCIYTHHALYLLICWWGFCKCCSYIKKYRGMFIVVILYRFGRIGMIRVNTLI